MCKIIVYTDDTLREDNKYKEIGHAIFQTDYLGNIYLKYNENYYSISLNSDDVTGIELCLIKNPDTFRNNLIETESIVSNIRSGTIKAGNQTLRGKINDTLTDMTDDEKEDYMLKNEFSSYDPLFHEKNYFWVQYNNDEDILDDDNEENGYYLNGVITSDPLNETNKGIVYSDLLCLTPGTFDTILIEGDTRSKYVISNIARVDEYCTSRLTAYTSGFFRTNFFDSCKMARLCLENNHLIMKKSE